MLKGLCETKVLYRMYLIAFLAKYKISLFHFDPIYFMYGF